MSAINEPPGSRSSIAAYGASPLKIAITGVAQVNSFRDAQVHRPIQRQICSNPPLKIDTMNEDITLLAKLVLTILKTNKGLEVDILSSNTFKPPCP